MAENYTIRGSGPCILCYAHTLCDPCLRPKKLSEKTCQGMPERSTPRLTCVCMTSSKKLHGHTGMYMRKQAEGVSRSFGSIMVARSGKQVVQTIIKPSQTQMPPLPYGVPKLNAVLASVLRPTTPIRMSAEVPLHCDVYVMYTTNTACLKGQYTWSIGASYRHLIYGIRTVLPKYKPTQDMFVLSEHLLACRLKGRHTKDSN